MPTTSENNKREEGQLTTEQVLVIAKRRNTSVELLRFLFMFSIVLLHIYGYGMQLDYESIYKWGASIQTAPHLMLFSFCKVGVTGFMFISGYYGIRMNKNKWLTMLVMLIFYGVILTVVIGEKTPVTIVNAIIRPFDAWWWYVSCYLFICVLSPLIEKGISMIDRATFRNVVIAAIVYTYFIRFMGVQNDHDVRLLLTIYLTARYLKIYPPYFLINIKA